MTVIRPNSVSGINSITAQADEIKVFKSDGTQGGLIIGGANLNATSGISTILALNVTGNVSIAGTLTYQDVTNVDSVGIITARSTIDAQGDVSIADKIIHTGDTNTAIRFPAADTVTIETGGSERLRIDSNGKITHTNFNGQGLHMSGSGDPTIRIQDTDGTNQYGDFAHNAGDTYILTRNNTTHGEFVLYSNNGSATSVRLKIDYNGKILTYTTGIESSQFLTTNSGGAYQQYDLGASGAQLGYIGAGSLLVSGSGVNDFGFRSQANMVFSTGGAVERLRITSGGQIRLPVNGQQMAFGASQQFKMYWENSEDRMYLQGDGAYGMAFRINGGNRLEINKTTGDVTMQGSSGRNFNWDNSEASLYLTDNGSGASARLKIGSGADLQLYHDVGGANHIVCANNQELKLSANKHTFYDYSGVTKRMEIDSNGYLTKPNTPAFLAYHYGYDINYGPNATLPYPFTAYNTGNHYNTSKSTFTAPVAGRYLFSANANGNYTSSYSGIPRAYWKINGSNVGNNIHLRGSDATHDGLEQRSQTVIFNLAANDTVKIVVGQNQWDLFGANSFTGYLIG